MPHVGCNFYFSFWAIFCHFTPTARKIKMKKQKNKKTKKNKTKKKKTTGDIIILHMCTKTYDQMMYSSRDMVPNRQMDGLK